MLEALNRLVTAGHDDEEFRLRADAVVRRALDVDVAAWSTTDPATGLLTSCHVVGLPYDASRERSVFRCEYESDGDIGARYADLARAAVPAAALSISTGGEVRRSVRHREILEPAGAVDELRVAFVAGGVPWGTLTAYRYEGKPPFSERDVEVAAAVGPVVAVGIRRGLLRRASEHPLAADVIPEPGIGPDRRRWRGRVHHRCRRVLARRHRRWWTDAGGRERPGRGDPVGRVRQRLGSGGCRSRRRVGDGACQQGQGSG